VIATAYADQLYAAGREAENTLRRVGRPADVDLRARPWLASQVDVYAAHAAAGTLRCCPHLGLSPQVAHTAAWAPDRLVCSLCVLQLRPASLAEDCTCDRCHQLSPAIHAGVLALGPVLLTFGLCPSCLRLDTPTPTRKETRP
jgi:hypothetical protein